MRSLKSLLRLPNPVEEGWSEYNSLGSEMFGLQPGQKSWEDFDRHLKVKYPVRAFIGITCRDWVLYKVWYPCTRPFKDAHYWLVSHIIPSRRYHMLDLRKARTGYSHGWTDADNQLECAMFAILNNFVEGEKPWMPTEEDVANEPAEWGGRDCLQRQRDNGLEAQAIYTWWNIDRIAAEKAIDNETSRLFGRRVANPSEAEMKALDKMEAEFEATKEEMMVRLVKVRHSLWT